MPPTTTPHPNRPLLREIPDEDADLLTIGVVIDEQRVAEQTAHAESAAAKLPRVALWGLWGGDPPGEWLRFDVGSGMRRAAVVGTFGQATRAAHAIRRIRPEEMAMATPFDARVDPRSRGASRLRLSVYEHRILLAIHLRGHVRDLPYPARTTLAWLQSKALVTRFYDPSGDPVADRDWRPTHVGAWMLHLSR